MAIGLKNAQEILPTVANDVQFAVSEVCATDNSCSAYSDFTNGRGTRGAAATGKPVFHVEYVTRGTSSGGNGRGGFGGSRSAAVVTTSSIHSEALPNLSPDALRKKLCLQSGASKSTAKISTVIKELSLDGWIMDCDGKDSTTRTRATKGSGRRE